MGVTEFPRFEADGSISWIPANARPLCRLEIRQQLTNGEWLVTYHASPAEIFHTPQRLYIRKPKRAYAGSAWHTVEMEIDPFCTEVALEQKPEGTQMVLIVRNK